MNKTVGLLSKEVPIFGEYDVVVVGGGVSGFAAATAAARNGVKTLVIEKDAFLGGMATGGMVSQFLGFVDGQEEPRGIMGELLKKLLHLDATTGLYEIKLAGVYSTKTAGYDSEILKYVLDEVVVGSGSDILLHTKVTDVDMEGDIITGLIIHNSEGYGLVKSKVFIDATFHGNVAVGSGCQWEKGRPGDGALQPGALGFRMANVDYQKFDQLNVAERKAIAQRGLAEGRLYSEALISRPVFRDRPPNSTLVYFNQSRVTFDPQNARSLTKAEIEGRKQVQNIANFYKQNVPGFEKAFLVSTGAYLGQRDSRRIMGKYILNKEDILSGTKFPDAVVASSYPVDIHDGPVVTFIKPGNGVQYIPYRCMVNNIVKNLIVTGRCISATFEAHGAVRVMVPCIQMGEAAGTAAAMSVEMRKSVSDFDGATISSKLLGQRSGS